MTNGSKGVIVSWSQSKNASGYYIYRKEKKSDSWKKVKTVDGKTTKWTDTDVKAGKQYYYTVVAYRSKSEVPMRRTRQSGVWLSRTLLWQTHQKRCCGKSESQ